MKINNILASACVAALFALEAWTLKSVVDLKVQVAELAARVSQTKTIIAKNQ